MYKQNTINVEKFAGLNIRGFSPMKVLQKYFCGILPTIVYFIPIAKNSLENFHSTLKNRKNRECLAQRIFPRLRYTSLSKD